MECYKVPDIHYHQALNSQDSQMLYQHSDSGDSGNKELSFNRKKAEGPGRGLLICAIKRVRTLSVIIITAACFKNIYSAVSEHHPYLIV